MINEYFILLLCKINIFDISGFSDLQIFVVSSSTEILIDKNI